ncbi:hypothetical protein [Inquilinus sp.]|uniref:hypothetical protein n=1 Tax=Inquilinus sp. TaxID=1932117 RepID=UPI0037841D4B
MPALRAGDIATFDLASLSGEAGDPVGAQGRAAMDRLAASLQDAPAASILRRGIGCLEITRAAMRAGRRPTGPERGFTVFRGGVSRCFRDARLAREAVLWPLPKMVAWLQPWIEPRKIAGDAQPCPEAWRLHLGQGGVAAASLVHPESSLAPEGLDASGCAAALEAGSAVPGRMREEGILPRLQGAARPDGILCAADVPIDEAGRALLLDGAQAPARDHIRPGWRGAFPPGADVAGIAIGNGLVLPLSRAGGGAAEAA